MNKLVDGTEYRDTTAGIIAVRGKRELHFIGKSVEATRKARELLATRSFDSLYKAAKATPHTRNSRFLKIG